MSDNNVFNQNTPEQSPPLTPKPQNPFDVPVESITLPSNGLVYPLGHPLSNEDAIEIKAMTAKEEDLLSSRALIKNGTVISALLKSCILNKLIDPDDMLAGDRNAILIGIRVTGYGSDYAVRISCPSCDKDFENTFSLNGLKIKRLTQKPLKENTNIFDFTLPASRSYCTL